MSAENDHSLVLSLIVDKDPELTLKHHGLKREDYGLLIMDMNTCSTTGHSFSLFDELYPTLLDFLRKSYIQVIPYFDGNNKTYDVLVYGSICNGTVCKITLDSNANKINGPVAYLPANFLKYDVSMHPLDAESSPNGFFVIIRQFDADKLSYYKERSQELRARLNLTYQNNDVMKLKYASEDGNVTDLFQIEGIKGYERLLHHANDTSNNLFSFCWTVLESKKQIHCVQYDSQGHKKMDVQVDLYYNRGFKVYNSAKYGLLFYTTNPTDNYDATVGVTLTQIKSDGVGKSWKLPVPECFKIESYGGSDFYRDYSISEMENHEFCLKIDCRITKTFYYKCYTLNS